MTGRRIFNASPWAVSSKNEGCPDRSPNRVKEHDGDSEAICRYGLRELPHKVAALARPGDESAEVVFRLLMDFQACCQFIAFYVPSCSFVLELCDDVIGQFQRAIDLRAGTVISSGVHRGANLRRDAELVFMHRAFLYVEACCC